MCGIVGYVGSKKCSNEVLLNGLYALEYRGYDSAGMAVFLKDKLHIVKTCGKVKNLEDKIREEDLKSSNIGIAHTRWATHGEVSEVNAHPFCVGDVVLVHNGILENYNEIKEELIQKGVLFKSSCDSEVACAYINEVYQKCKDPLLALQKANQRFIGSFAFALLFKEEKDTLYAMRRNSPLLVGESENMHFIASDISALLKYTKKYQVLKENQIAKIKQQDIEIYNMDLQRCEISMQISQMNLSSIQKEGYEHFMLKEIYEQPEVIKKIMQMYLNKNIEFKKEMFPPIKKYNCINIVACGSAMYAGFVAKVLLEEHARMKVDVEIASEYRYKNPILDKNTLVIFISQSGETADTLACLKMVKEKGIDTFAIVNVKESSIAKEAKYVAYTLAGVEVSVASTKAYSAQLALLSLFALYASEEKGFLLKEEKEEILKQIKTLPVILNSLMKKTNYKKIAEIIAQKEDVFFLGRGLDYALCLEGALKLKEISYIHAEAYAAGEMKHGTISLIEKNTPVIALCSEKHLFEKMVSNIKEVKTRGAYVILIACEKMEIKEDVYDEIILLPKVNRNLQALVNVVVLQLLAYYVAKRRGCEIDKPKNLAKSVTVE